MRARCVAIPADLASAESHRSLPHVWTRQDRPQPPVTRCVARKSVRLERASHSVRHRRRWAVCVTPVGICRQACHDGRRLGRVVLKISDGFNLEQEDVADREGEATEAVGDAVGIGSDLGDSAHWPQWRVAAHDGYRVLRRRRSSGSSAALAFG